MFIELFKKFKIKYRNSECCLPFYLVTWIDLLLMVYQCADGYHHRMDGLRAIMRNKRYLSIIFREFLNFIKKNKTYVHAHASYSWPAVTFSFVFPVSTTGFQDRFINTTTSGANTFLPKPKQNINIKNILIQTSKTRG